MNVYNFYNDERRMTSDEQVIMERNTQRLNKNNNVLYGNMKKRFEKIILVRLKK